MEIKQKLSTINLHTDTVDGTLGALRDACKEVAEKTIPKKEKKCGPTWISQNTQGRGDQALNENRGKMGRSKKTKRGSSKQNQETRRIT
jgi:hypothetical protein